MKKLIPFSYLLLFCLIGCQPSNEKSNSISVSFAEAVNSEHLDGRLLLMLSNNDEKEPRFQINDGLNTQLIFGMNVDGMTPGETITIDDSVFGYPYSSLFDVPPGEYNVQALLHVYETFNLSTGHMVKLPMDNGEGQQWSRSPGNLYSKPFKIKVTEKGIQNVEVVMDQVVPPIEEPADTEWIKHIKVKSEK